jgi:hypothetical protein
VTLVLENGGRRDALLAIDAHNPGDRRVRVDSLRLTYLERDVAVGELDPATSLFRRAIFRPIPSSSPEGETSGRALLGAADRRD